MFTSLVPLKDLLDEPKEKDRYMFVWFILGELRKSLIFPFPYFTSNAVFERKNDALEKIIVIENARSILQGLCPHCNGNYSKNR
ncbi:MAG: hypothetical protein ACFFB5_13710 [Promethearchaeota archaeon]